MAGLLASLATVNGQCFISRRTYVGIVKFTANEVLGIKSGILRAGMEHAGVEIKIKGAHLRVLACWYQYGMARCCDCWEKPGRGMSAIVVVNTEG